MSGTRAFACVRVVWLCVRPRARVRVCVWCVLWLCARIGVVWLWAPAGVVCALGVRALVWCCVCPVGVCAWVCGWVWVCGCPPP